MPGTLNLKEAAIITAFYIGYVIFIFQKITYIAIYIPTILLRLFSGSKQKKEKAAVVDLEAFLLFLESMSVYLGSGDSLEKSIYKYVEKIGEKNEFKTDIIYKGSEFERLSLYYVSVLASGKNVTEYFELLGKSVSENRIIYRFMKIIIITIRTSGEYKSLIDETIKNTRQQIFYFYDVHSSLAEKSFEIKILTVMPYALLIMMKTSLGSFFFSGYESLSGMIALSIIFFTVEVSSLVASRNMRFNFR